MRPSQVERKIESHKSQLYKKILSVLPVAVREYFNKWSRVYTREVDFGCDNDNLMNIQRLFGRRFSVTHFVGHNKNRLQNSFP